MLALHWTAFCLPPSNCRSHAAPVAGSKQHAIRIVPIHAGWGFATLQLRPSPLITDCTAGAQPAPQHASAQYIPDQHRPSSQQCPRHRKAARRQKLTAITTTAAESEQADASLAGLGAQDEEALQELQQDRVHSKNKNQRPDHRSNKERQAVHLISDRDVEASQDQASTQPPESGVLPSARIHHISVPDSLKSRGRSGRPGMSEGHGGVLYPPAESNRIRGSWQNLMRWSRILSRSSENGVCVLDKTEKVVVFGGGSFGTAMAAALARQKPDLSVTMLLRDPYMCKEINKTHINSRYLEGYTLPINVYATTSAEEAIDQAQYALHAVPVQHSREFLTSIVDLLPRDVPVISVSKGLERGTGKMMSEVIAATLGNRQPCAFLSGPSFAKEVMDLRPTGVVAASKDKGLAKAMQGLFASSTLRVNTTTDVVGVEICGALKNVLAIAAGIVEGLQLGNNAMAALIAQGCSEIRWLAEKMGAKPETISGLSGLGDIMLTCYGSLSRNRAVGVRLGQGEALQDIVGSSHQVAEGVATAGVVVALAAKLRVSLPVLTAVAQVLDGALTPTQAVADIMNLPQIEER